MREYVRLVSSLLMTCVNAELLTGAPRTGSEEKITLAVQADPHGNQVLIGDDLVHILGLRIDCDADWIAHGFHPSPAGQAIGIGVVVVGVLTVLGRVLDTFFGSDVAEPEE